MTTQRHPTFPQSRLCRLQAPPSTCRFTLIELLVVVAIIAILASLLLPVLSTAREKARTSACASQLKQMGMGLTMYCEDNKGSFPPLRPIVGDYNQYAWWFTLMAEYVGVTPTVMNANWYPKDKSVMICPAYWQRKGGVFSRWACMGYGLPHYANGLGGNPGQSGPPRFLREVIDADAVTMLADVDGSGLKMVGSWPVDMMGNHGEKLGTNICFVDGHVNYWGDGRQLYEQHVKLNNTKYPINRDLRN